MKLVPLQPDLLATDRPLAFSIRDREGRLLLARGHAIATEQERQQLLERALYVDYEETEAWHREKAAQVNQAFNQKRTLKEVAALRPVHLDSPTAPIKPQRVEHPYLAWGDLQVILSVLLHENLKAEQFLLRFEKAASQAERLMTQDPDTALYTLIQSIAGGVADYSSNHALLSGVICRMASSTLGWSDAEQRIVFRAALTMNIGMTALQDRLATQETPPNLEQRQWIKRHPDYGVQLLQRLGISDPDWLDAVRQHHESTDGRGYPEGRTQVMPMAQLLHQVDIFVAHLSPRKTRRPLTANIAAKRVYMGVDGQANPMGAAIVKTLGIYPPGSFVRLASEEIAVVVKRGRRANLPAVVSVMNREGMPLAEPSPRDPLDKRFEVVGAVPLDSVKLRLNHQKILGRSA